MKNNLLLLLTLIPLIALSQESTNEIVVERGLDNKIQKSFTVSNDTVKNGEYKYIIDELVATEGQYKDNKRAGSWIFRYDKNFLMTGNYIDGLKSGNWYIIYKKDTLSVLNYKNDKYSGLQKYFYKNGKLALTQYYHNGNFEASTFDKKGNKRSNHILDDKILIIESFSDNSKQYRLVWYNKTPIDLEVYSDDKYLKYSGKLKQGNGNIIINYDKKGKNRCEYSIKDSTKNGEFKYFEYNLLSIEGQFKNGYMDGLWRYYEYGRKINEKIYYAKDLNNLVIENYIDILIEYYLSKHESIDKISIPTNLLSYINFSAATSPIYDEHKISGKVEVSFTINEVGEITDIEVLKSPSTILSDEITRILSIAPIFPPLGFPSIPHKKSYTTQVSFIKNTVRTYSSMYIVD